MSTNSRVPTEHALIGQAAKITINHKPHPVFSLAPVVLETPQRQVDLQLRVSAPTVGDKLPIILLSHGHGRSNHLSSLNGYGPLANFYAAHGFAVFQPTHLSSKSLGLESGCTGDTLFWRSRAEDMTILLDQIDEIEAQVPQLRGRLDHDHVAVVGHSLGAHTALAVLGMRVTDVDGAVVQLADSRIKAGVALTPIGRGDALSDFARENFPFMRHSDFSTLKTPVLVAVGDEDNSTHLSTGGPAWHEDPYHLAPGPKALLTIRGGKHGLGGLSGYDSAEAADDESVERAGVVQRLTWAYLRTALYPENSTWSTACNDFANLHSLGKVESK